MKIKNKIKFTNKLIEDFLFIKRKLTKLSYFLNKDDQINLINYLTETEMLILDINEKILEEECAKN